MSSTMRFCLLDDPWIPVTDRRGQSHLVGLRRALIESHDFVEISAEAPVITLALRRLLLAVLHAVVGPDSAKRWAALWDSGTVPAGEVNAYLDQRTDRFDLFGPRPFYQCPELDESLAKPVSLLRWVQTNNKTLFDHTSVARTEVFEPAAAARWLIAQQAFDVYGTKTAHGGGRHFAKAAPLAGAAVLQLLGENLFETLLLNLVRVDPANDLPFPAEGAGTPVWDRDPPGPAPTTRLPEGYLDWLTWPARRIRLIADSTGSVAQVVITEGDRLPDGAPVEVYEQFTSSRASTGNSSTGWTAIKLDPGRAAWRSFADLLRPSTDSRRRPSVLDWLQQLRRAGLLDRSRFELDVGGMATSDSKIELWRLERHPVPTRLLADEVLMDFLDEALALAHDIRNTLRAALVWKYPRKGPSPEPGEFPPLGEAAADRAVTAYWAAASQGLDQLLAALDRDPVAAGRSWFDHLVRSAHDAAAPFLGDGDARQLARVSIAERRLRAGLAARRREFEDSLAAVVDWEQVS